MPNLMDVSLRLTYSISTISLFSDNHMVSKSCINDGKKLTDQRRDNIFQVTSGD